jgi:hypothetical protein
MKAKKELIVSRVKWIFNPLMIWGAVLGFLIFGGVGQIRDACHHQGTGYVTYEQPERTVAVSENQYKRHEYTMGALMLGIGLVVWVVLAKNAKDAREKNRQR